MKSSRSVINMAELTCSVNTCASHNGGYCCRNSIKIDGHSAVMKDQTFCGSFQQKTGGAALCRGRQSSMPGCGRSAAVWGCSVKWRPSSPYPGRGTTSVACRVRQACFHRAQVRTGTHGGGLPFIKGELSSGAVFHRCGAGMWKMSASGSGRGVPGLESCNPRGSVLKLES